MFPPILQVAHAAGRLTVTATKVIPGPKEIAGDHRSCAYPNLSIVMPRRFSSSGSSSLQQISRPQPAWEHSRSAITLP